MARRFERLQVLAAALVVFAALVYLNNTSRLAWYGNTCRTFAPSRARD